MMETLLKKAEYYEIFWAAKRNKEKRTFEKNPKISLLPLRSVRDTCVISIEN